MHNANGGHAFPIQTGVQHHHGMSLQEYWVGQVLIAVVNEAYRTGTMISLDDVGVIAYDIVDNVLDELLARGDRL